MGRQKTIYSFSHQLLLTFQCIHLQCSDASDASNGSAEAQLTGAVEWSLGAGSGSAPFLTPTRVRR